MPRWRRDGRELYYLQPNESLMLVNVDTGAAFHAGDPHFIAAAPFRITTAASFHMDVTAVGKRLIGTAYADTEDTASTSPINVVLNLTAGLRK